MQAELISEARRQAEICNACRYCEGYCAVFPALHRQRAFADADLTQLANLCHDCRGCYYACQYTEPHEFAVNLPRALSELRRDSWQSFAWPRGAGRLFDRNGVVIAAGLVVTLIALFALVAALASGEGAGFYAYLSHNAMVAVFLPAFLFPLLALVMAITAYWRHVGGGRLRWADIASAFQAAAQMRYLSGGHGDGCNFEDLDRFSHARRHFHHAAMYGFLLCFAATASGTVLHYVFDWPAPYGLLSPPKLLGLPGGVLLCLGTLGLAALRLRADRAPAPRQAWGGDMAFVLLLFAVSATGLALYAATGTGAVAILLPVHLACVLTFFVLTPYSKMAHGFFRLAALAQEAQVARRAAP